MGDAIGKYNIRITDIVLALVIGLVPTIALIAIGKGSAAHWIVTLLFSIGIVTFVWALLEEGATGAPFYIKLGSYGALFMISATFIMAVLNL